MLPIGAVFPFDCLQCAMCNVQHQQSATTTLLSELTFKKEIKRIIRIIF